MIAIENENFRAGVRINGAQLASLIDKSTGREWIWQADPAVWNGSAPILFPIVGKLKDDTTRINGKPYCMPKHGLLRGRDAELVEHQTDRAVLRFCSNDKTRVHYPFEFTFDAAFELTGRGLDVTYTVLNPGDETMYFTLGSHPAFALDLESHRLSDYYIEFSEPETLDLFGLGNGLLVKCQTAWLNHQRSIRLSEDLFNQDALIFKHLKSRTIRLQPVGLELDIRNHPHLGIWAKPGAAYVCLEPWFSYDDSADAKGTLENKPGIMTLPAGEHFETGYAIRAFHK